MAESHADARAQRNAAEKSQAEAAELRQRLETETAELQRRLETLTSELQDKVQLASLESSQSNSIGILRPMQIISVVSTGITGTGKIYLSEELVLWPILSGEICNTFCSGEEWFDNNCCRGRGW